MDKKILKNLQDLDLTEKESKVYLAGLKIGSCSIRKMAKKTGLNRGSVYEAIKSLLRKGLFSSFIDEGRRYYTAESPEKLISYILEKEEKAKDLLKKAQTIVPRLKPAYFLSIPSDIDVKIFEGEKGLSGFYDDIFNTLTSGNELLRLGIPSQYFTAMPAFFKKQLARRIKLGIKNRMILPRSEIAKGVQKGDKKELRQTRFLPEKIFYSKTIIDIYANKVAFLLLQEKIKIILIENKEIADSMRRVFEILWKIAEK